MGEVYRARDATLDRDVAIRVLAEELAADPERPKRFEREAELLASLNHPNIASIYGSEPHGGVRALERRVAGAVLLEVVIGKNRIIGPVRMLKGLDIGLDLNAIRCARAWRFAPGTLNGEPVDMVDEIQVELTIL